MATGTRGSPLLELPAELRNAIYEYTLVSTKTVELGTKSATEQTALLRVCKQIQNEATSVFYHGNSFAVTASLENNDKILQGLQIVGHTSCMTIPKLWLKFIGPRQELFELDRRADSLFWMGGVMGGLGAVTETTNEFRQKHERQSARLVDGLVDAGIQASCISVTDEWRAAAGISVLTLSITEGLVKGIDRLVEHRKIATARHV